MVLPEKKALHGSSARKGEASMSISQSLTSTKKVERPLFGRELSTYIEVPPDTVFRYIADICRHAEWSAEPLDITLESGPDHGQGATFRTAAHVGKNKITARVCVIAEEPPVRFVYESKDLFGLHRWTMTLRGEGSGTRLTQRMERVQGPLWVRILQPYVMWPTVGRRSVGKGLARIKSRLEDVA
jgi:hypothetical protein